MGTLVKQVSPAMQLAEIVEAAKLARLARRGKEEEISGDEVKELGVAMRALTELERHHPEMVPALNLFRSEIRRLKRRYTWECMECGTLFNHSDEMIADEGLPTCPGCNSQDYEPN